MPMIDVEKKKKAMNKSFKVPFKLKTAIVVTALMIL